MLSNHAEEMVSIWTPCPSSHHSIMLGTMKAPANPKDTCSVLKRSSWIYHLLGSYQKMCPLKRPHKGKIQEVGT